jgi:tRNA-2-methylthio-N6-dimethylallyladenosine synthase
LSLRRTRGGDAWAARQESGPRPVSLGLPSVGVPA